MTSTIGKVSGIDWSKAPIDTTHVGLSENTLKGMIWYRQVNGDDWFYYGEFSKVWMMSDPKLREEWKIISKEEDLDMSIKQVSSVDDLEVGMFIKSDNGTIRLVLALNGAIHTAVVFPRVKPRDVAADWGLHQFNTIVSEWSYTFEGEYTPVVVDERSNKIRELEETIALASKQIKELRGC